MKHRIVSVLITIFVLLLYAPINAFGFDEGEHNEYMERVLFGKTAYKQVNKEELKNVVQSLEYASYLCVDQYSAHLHPNDSKKIEYLKNRKIDDVPELSEIDFIGNQYHRRYTHKGWNYNYENDDKANWQKRKTLLLNTVNKELRFGYFSKKLWFGYDPKCEHFAALLYYVHVLGDYIAAEWKTKETTYNMIHLADQHDKSNSLIIELQQHLSALFKDQKKESYDYKGLMKAIDEINSKASAIQHSEGGINTEEEFNIYHQCALDLMDVLIERVPKLLKNEEFFAKVFYKK